jgi:acetyl-CoA C-acetyltransferase
MVLIPRLLERDEHPRPDTTCDALAALKPVFRKDGIVTAGHSGGISDVTAALAHP